MTAGLGGWVYLHNIVETYLLSVPLKADLLDGTNLEVQTPRCSTKRAVLRSLFFPGLGQRYAGNTARGFIFRTGVFVMALFTLDEKLQLDLAEIDYKTAEALFDGASVDDKKALLNDLTAKKTEVNDCEDRLNTMAIATGALWALNIIDAIISRGGNIENGRMEFETSVLSSTVRSGICIKF